MEIMNGSYAYVGPGFILWPGAPLQSASLRMAFDVGTPSFKPMSRTSADYEVKYYVVDPQRTEIDLRVDGPWSIMALRSRERLRVIEESTQALRTVHALDMMVEP